MKMNLKMNRFRLTRHQLETLATVFAVATFVVVCAAVVILLAHAVSAFPKGH